MFALIREDVRSVFQRDPAARNVFEILTTYPGVHALLFHRLCHWLWRKGACWLARWLSSVSRFLTGIEIHPAARIGRRFFIDHGMGVVIGATAEIGDDVTLYQGVTLGGTSTQGGKRHPTLGNGVIVGAGAKILGGFTVGDHARIGSNAVVVREVPPDTTIVGVPGHAVLPRNKNEQLRQAMQDKLGFDAYGMRGGMPDPLAEVMAKMLEHIEKTDQRMDTMCQLLHKLGEEVNLPQPLREVLTEEQLRMCREASQVSSAETSDRDS